MKVTPGRTELVNCTFHASEQIKLNLATKESAWHGSKHGSKAVESISDFNCLITPLS